MFLGHCVLFSLLLGNAILAQKDDGGDTNKEVTIKESDTIAVTSEASAPEKHPFRLYTLCHGNSTQCHVDRCRYRIDFGRRCVHCQCDSQMLDMPKASESVAIQAGSVTFNISNMQDNDWVPRTYGLPIDEKNPYIVHSIKKTEENMSESTLDLRQVFDKLAISENPILLPVVVSLAGDLHSEPMGDLYEKSIGIATDVPFLKQSLQTEAIPGILFQNCDANTMVHETDHTNSHDLYQRHLHPYYDILTLFSNDKIVHAFAKIIEDKIPKMEYHLCFGKAKILSRSQYRLLAVVEKLALSINRSVASFSNYSFEVNSTENDLNSTQLQESLEFVAVIKNITFIARKMNSKDMLEEIKHIDTKRLHNLAVRLGNITEHLRRKDIVLKHLIDSLVFLGEYEPLSPKGCMQNMLFELFHKYLWMEKPYDVVDQVFNFLQDKVELNQSHYPTNDRILTVTNMLLRSTNLSDITMNITRRPIKFKTVWNITKSLLDTAYDDFKHIESPLDFAGKNAYEFLVRKKRVLDFLHADSKPMDRIEKMLSTSTKILDKIHKNALDEFRKFISNLKLYITEKDYNFTNLTVPAGQKIVNDFNMVENVFSHLEDFPLLQNFTEIVREAFNSESKNMENEYKAYPTQQRNGSQWLHNTAVVIGNNRTMGCPSWSNYTGHYPFSFHAYNGSWMHMAFSQHQAKWHCIFRLVEMLSHLDFQTVMASVERSLCNATLRHEGEEEESRINKTLKYINDVNGTFDRMLNELENSASMISRADYDFINNLIANMTSIREVKPYENQKLRIKNIIDKMSYFKTYMARSNFYRLEGISDLLNLFDDVIAPSNPVQMLCRIARNRHAIQQVNMTFGDVMVGDKASSMLIKILRNNETASVEMFEKFLLKSNLTVIGNITLKDFADLVEITGLSAIYLSEKYLDKFHKNLSKILHHVPRLNSPKHRMCLQRFKNVSDTYSINSNKTKLIDVVCVFGILKQLFTKESPFAYLEDALNYIEIKLKHHKEIDHVDYYMKNAESDVNASSKHFFNRNGCHARSISGLFMVDDSHPIPSSSSTEFPIVFKQFRGSSISTLRKAKFLFGIMWINTPKIFDTSTFLSPWGKNHTNGPNEPGFSDEVPVDPHDEIPEIFVETNQSDEIFVKSVLQSEKVALWRVLITKGRWIVKDTLKSLTKRRIVGSMNGETDGSRVPITSEFDQVEHVAGWENECPDDIEEGWRCLKNQDMISADAILKLLPHSATDFAIGIIAFIPANGSFVSAGSAKARNLIATRFIPGATNHSVIGSENGSPIHVKITAGKEVVFKIFEIGKFVSAWDNKDLDVLKTFAETNVFASNLLKRIKNAMRWPNFQFQGLHKDFLDTIALSFRDNSTKIWKSFKPGVKFRFSPTAEIRVMAQLASSNYIVNLMFSLDNGKSIKIVLDVQSPLPVLTMVVPKNFYLPPIPFNITGYTGFAISDVVPKLLSSSGAADFITGLTVHDVTKSSIGTWEIRCDSCDEWTNLGNTGLDEEIAGATAKKGSKCSGETVILLSSQTRVRFRPHKPNTFWKATAAWKESSVTLSLYRIIVNMTETEDIQNDLRDNGFSRVTGTYRYTEYCQEMQIVDFSTLLSSTKRKFVIERLGCDGRKSSLKIAFDRCGICGGAGDSCVDCIGAINGTAYYDKCQKCVGGSTGQQPTILDCALRCDDTNYEDECGFCQERGKKIINFKDCTGECFGLAKLDKCGVCRTKNGMVAHLPEGAKLIDACGKCGGDNSTCAGCDEIPNSGKVVDKCGNCKKPSDPTFNQGCGSIFYISRVIPAVIVVKRAKDQTYLNIGGYFNTHEEVSCSLRNPATGYTMRIGTHKVVKVKSKLPVDESVHALEKVTVKHEDLLPEGVGFAKWNLICEYQNDKSTFETQIYARAVNPWGLISIQPKSFQVHNGGGNVTITAKGFPNDTDLVCGAVYYSKDALDIVQKGDASFTSLSFLKTTRLFKVDAIKLNGNMVQCTFPNSSNPASLTVHVLSKMEVENSNPLTIARNVKGGLNFEYRDKAPSVIEARITDDLKFISILFDTDVTIAGMRDIKSAEDLCKLTILESALLGTLPRCFLRGSRIMFIRPGKTATVPASIAPSDQVIGIITLRKGVFFGRGATDSLPEKEVRLHRPQNEILPKVYLRLPQKVEPCESIKIDVGVLEGVGAWKLRYNWSVTGFLSNEENVLNKLMKAVSNRRRAVITFNDASAIMQSAGNYTISVRAINAFGKAGSFATSVIRVKDNNSALRVYIVGSNGRIIKSSSRLNLKAYAKFLRPKCNGENTNRSLTAENVKDIRIEYVWEAFKEDGSGIDLEGTSDRKLTISRGALKPGVYRFQVTAIYFEDEETISAQSLIMVRVESSHLIAKIVGPKSRLITTAENLIIDGSRSTDPDGGLISITYSCVQFETGLPCSVKSINGTAMERADAVFPLYQDGGILNFPGRLFAPDMLVTLSLKIQSGNRTASDEVYVFIHDENSNLPSISFAKAKDVLKDLVSPNQVVRLTANILGNNAKNWTMLLKWTCMDEEGFSFVDLLSASLTKIEDTKEIMGGRRGHFSLVIKKNVLQPGSSYKFRLQATADPEVHPLEDGQREPTIYADVLITTSQIATGGILKYSPSNGSALTTEFTLSTEDWLVSDDVTDTIFYRFAYRNVENTKLSKSSITFLGPFSDRPELTTILPAGLSEMDNALSVIVFVRIGEYDNTIQKAIASIQVHPMKIEDDVIDDIKSRAAEALVSGNRDETVANILLLQNVVQSKSTKLEIKNLADQTMNKMETFIPTTEREAGDALDDARNLLSSFDGNVTMSDDSKRISRGLVHVALKDLYKKKDVTTPSRRRRSTDDQDIDIPEAMAEKMLEMYDTVFLLSGTSSELLQETRSKFEEDSDFIMSKFCTSVGFDEPAISVDTGITFLGVEKVDMPHSSPFGPGAQSIILSNAVQSQYVDWDCDSDEATCPGACISYGIYQEDTINHVENLSSPLGVRISPITAFFIRNPTSGSIDMGSRSNFSGMNDHLIIEYSNISLPAGTSSDSIECRHLHSTKTWERTGCSISVNMSFSKITCTCNDFSGYFAIFTDALPATSAPVMTTMGEVTCPADMEVARTCNELQKCSIDECQIGKTCVCADAMDEFYSNSSCVESCPESVFTTKQPGSPPMPPRDGMATGAIVGLTITLIFVTAILLVVVKYYHSKAQERRVTPTNSMVLLSTPPPAYEPNEEKRSSTTKVEPNDYEMAPLPNAPPQYSEDPQKDDIALDIKEV